MRENSTINHIFFINNAETVHRDITFKDIQKLFKKIRACQLLSRAVNIYCDNNSIRFRQYRKKNFVRVLIHSILHFFL